MVGSIYVHRVYYWEYHKPTFALYVPMIVLWWEISPSYRSTAAYGQNWQSGGHHCWAEVSKWTLAQTAGKINTSKILWVIIGVLNETPDFKNARVTIGCSCLLLIAHPNLPGVRKQTSTSDLEHIPSIMFISLADAQHRGHEDLHNLYYKFLVIWIQRLSLGEQCLYSKIKTIKPYLYVQYL